MGLTFKMEEPADSPAAFIDDGEIFTARLVGNNEKKRNFPSEPAPVTRVGWKFQIESDDDHNGRYVWGETGDKLVPHPECRLKMWSEALLGHLIPAGYELELDNLLEHRCRIIVGKREYEKDGETRYANFVREVHPTREAMQTLYQEEPF